MAAPSSKNPFTAAPKTTTPLGYHRILSPTAGVRVSPLCLGALNFGDAWSDLLGSCPKETVFEILDYFYSAGGNFIDTANNYQNEESETWIGEWMKARENRDEMVVATKFTNCFPAGWEDKKKMIKSNHFGNHAKSLKISLEASLRKLQTTYVDILYIHWWDTTTSIPELMQSLHHVVAAGKVLYLGISDTPAWVVSKANEYARQKGLTQFSVYQGHWSANIRDFERDIIPMAEAEGMALAPWGALGRGLFATAEELEKKGTEGRQTAQSNERTKAISAALEKIAKEKNTLITSIALAYVMHKSPYVFPIVGGRKIEHLKGNIEALAIELSEEEIDRIEGALPFDVGFPMNMLFEFGGKTYKSGQGVGDIYFSRPAGHFDVVQRMKPPKVRKE